MPAKHFLSFHSQDHRADAENSEGDRTNTLGIGDKSFNFYRLLGTVLSKHGWLLVRADQTAVEEDGVVRGYWEFEDESQQFRFRPDSELEVDFVYDKSHIVNADSQLNHQTLTALTDLQKTALVVNNPQFLLFANNKLGQQALLGEFMPAGEIITPWSKPISRPAVIKQITGSGGKNVELRENLSTINQSLAHDHIHQEFLDLKNDAGIAQDYRLVFVNHEFSYCFSRTASEPNEFRTNFFLGGAVDFLDPSSEIIAEILEMSAPITNRLKPFGKVIYALDFARDRASGKFKLIEINTKPGVDVFTPAEAQPAAEAFANGLLELAQNEASDIIRW